MWSREEISTGSAHEARSQGASCLDTQVSEESTGGSSSDTSARPDKTNSDGARTGDNLREGGTRPRPCIFIVSTDAKYKQDSAMAEGNQLKNTAAGVSAFKEAVLGQAFMGERISGRNIRKYNG